MIAGRTIRNLFLAMLATYIDGDGIVKTPMLSCWKYSRVMDEAMLWDAERRKAAKRARELPKKLQRLPLVQQMFSTTTTMKIVRYG